LKGILSKSPQTLTDAIKPIAPTCAKYEWAIALQNGPYREDYHFDEDDPRNLLYLFLDIPNIPNEWIHWFRRGILPEHAEDLICDEWSYYLGYDPDKYSAQNISQQLKNDISPHKELFDFLKENDCIYIMYSDGGLWEAYCKNPLTYNIFMTNWGGKEVESWPWEIPYDPNNFASRYSNTF